MRTFVIGDIHGCFDELNALIQQAGIKADDILIALGDIVDRGNKSKEVYEFLRSRPNTVVLMGNHERKHQRGILSYAQEIVKVQFGDDYTAFLEWLETLPYYYETPEAIIVHAFFEHDVPLQQQRQDVLCGSTSGDRYLAQKYAEGTFWPAYYTGTKPIIYGHHVVGDRPEIANNTYGIDTGCCHGQYLTAIELPGFTIHQVKAQKDYWKEEQKTGQIPVLKARNWADKPFWEIDRQLEKLAYITEPEVVQYLQELRSHKESLQAALPQVQSNLERLTARLLENEPVQFSADAAKYPFSIYLFKCRSGKLELADLVKGLDTPAKVRAIAILEQLKDAE